MVNRAVVPASPAAKILVSQLYSCFRVELQLVLFVQVAL